MKDLNIALKNIKAVVFDIDGVLTDGKVIYGDHGDEIKIFDVQDGFGIKLLSEAGLKSFILSARKSAVNKRRAKELRVTALFQGVDDKGKMLERISRKWRLGLNEICYVGDDWVDAVPMKLAGVSVAVANAVPEIKAIADYVTERTGGNGAAREVIDRVLTGLGIKEKVAQKYLNAESFS